MKNLTFRLLVACACCAFALAAGSPAGAQTASPQIVAAPAGEWTTAWTASVHGPYPVGSPVAQPDLRLVIPSADAGFVDQSLRLTVRPDVWGREARVRLSNAFGRRAVTFDGVYVGLQATGSALVAGTNRPVRFGGKTAVTVPPGASVVSDPVSLPWVSSPSDPMLANRHLGVSIHVVGESGPITWHSKAMASSYLSGPRVAMQTAAESETGFPYTVMSWFFLDAVDMRGTGAQTIVALGDSITDGTGSTINGDDRWPDVLARRLKAAYGDAAYSVVNAGIGANMIAGPADYAERPWPGGPPVTARLERDVLSLAGVRTVVWLEGINDFGLGKLDVGAVEAAVRDVVARLRQRLPGVRIVMGTVMSAKNSTIASHATADVDEKRQAFNRFIRGSGLFDAVVDFDAVTTDVVTGELKAEYASNSSVGGPGDKLHPNRAGYAAMAASIDLQAVTGLKLP